MISLCKSKIVIKKIFLTKHNNEQKERNFLRQKIQKNDLFKNRKITKIDGIDVNKILVSKEEPYGTKIYSNILPGTMTKTFLDRYG